MCALSAAKERTNEERGGGRDPGVRRPGAGRGQLPSCSKFFRAAESQLIGFGHTVSPIIIGVAK